MPRIRFALLCSALLWVSAPFGQAVTTLKVENPTAQARTDAVLTIGMVFRKGDIPAGKTLAIPGSVYQVDAKATHADGSLRHAVISLALGSMAANESRILQVSAEAPKARGAPLDPADVLKTAFDAKVALTVGGQAYSASARDLLAGAKTWLSGPVCTEWLITAPLKTAAGAVHPHLHVRFSIRAYQGLKSIRADVTVENDWTFEPSPMGYTYDAVITVGAVQAYAKTGLAHTNHARWRKVFWWGAEPAVEYAYDRDYLFATGAFPILDKSVRVSAAAISGLKEGFDPMSNGDLESYMPTTGAHNDIGPLPHFASIYLLTQDPRARRNVLANGACGGSFQIHYRHKATDLPVSLDAFPYMTLLGNPTDADNPKMGKSESFPAVTNPLETHEADDSHQPSIAFLPYAISGDHFQLEELQFWANWNMIMANPYSREFEKGLLKWGQLRAQAWSMRTLGQAAWITPDAHPLKKYFNDKVAHNLAWYVDRYPKNAKANPFGHMENDFPYPPFGIAPWMDDFFTWSMAYLHRLGFDQALTMAQWKAKFVVGRMTDPGFCWLQASVYSVQVGTADKVPFLTWPELYKANFPTAGACAGFKMEGYPDVATGYGANMQPALAAAVDVNAPGAVQAWEKYQTRNPKQDYSTLPEFAVVPDPNGSSRIGAPVSSGAKAGSGSRFLFLPGTRLSFRLDFSSDLFVEIYDTSGHRVASVSAGKKGKGLHMIDPLRDLPGARVLARTPYLVEIRAVDGFRHSEFLKLTVAAP